MDFLNFIVLSTNTNRKGKKLWEIETQKKNQKSSKTRVSRETNKWKNGYREKKNQRKTKSKLNGYSVSQQTLDY